MTTVDDYIQNKLTHSIHTSERRSFRGCRRRHHWLFVDHLYPTTTAKPLEFGSAFHKAMEEWYEPSTWDKDPSVRETLATLAFVNTCAQQKAEYVQKNGGTIDPEVEKDYEERVELGTGMIRYHCRNVSPKVDVGFRPIKTEIEFEVPILDPRGLQVFCRCDNCKTMWRNSVIGSMHHDAWQTRVERDIALDDSKYWDVVWEGLPLTYGGRIDMLAQDEYGRYWIFDWKTAARLSGMEEQESPDEFILLDDQITSYVWALWVLGLDVAGFVYHEMKKAFPEEPEPNKTQRKGCWYSVNKQQNTSYDLYLQTVGEGDPAGLASGAYDEFLDWLRTQGPKYFTRKQVQRSEQELKSAGFHIYQEACDITDPNLRVYPSPGRFACSFCAYRQPCIGLNRGEDIDYIFHSNFEFRPHRYWELAASNTDSKGGQ